VTVCIVDTSILVELLGVPHLSSNHEEYVASFEERVRAKETFLLPLPVLFETGNHIAQIPDGKRRRDYANRFLAFVKPALSGNTPFVPTPSPSIEDVASWLEDFPDHAMRAIGLVDRSLIDLFDRQKSLLKGRQAVYIWSLDEALMAYDTRTS